LKTDVIFLDRRSDLTRRCSICSKYVGLMRSEFLGLIHFYIASKWNKSKKL